MSKQPDAYSIRRLFTHDIEPLLGAEIPPTAVGLLPHFFGKTHTRKHDTNEIYAPGEYFLTYPEAWRAANEKRDREVQLRTEAMQKIAVMTWPLPDSGENNDKNSEGFGEEIA